MVSSVPAEKGVSRKAYAGNCTVLAEDQVLFARQLLRTGNWPPSVLPVTDRLATRVLTLAEFVVRCSRATTVSKTRATLRFAPNTAILADTIRKALKLPKVK